MFILKTIGGDRLEITGEQYKNITQAKENALLILKSGVSIKKSSIASIIPDNMENRKDQKTGVLYDGMRVFKHFGQWVNAENTETRINPEYYPEVARDCVATEKEYYILKDLTKEEYYKTLIEKDYKERQGSGELNHILKEFVK